MRLQLAMLPASVRSPSSAAPDAASATTHLAVSDLHELLGLSPYDADETTLDDKLGVASGLAYTANVGDAHIQGFEAEAAYDWDFGLSIRAHGQLSAPKFTQANPDFANELSSGLPGAPRASGGVLARYDRALPGDLTLRLIAQLSYVGSARLTFNPAFSARTDPVVNTQLIAQLARAPWTATIFVSNPADRSGNTFAYGNPFTFGLVRQITPQRPRTVGVRLAAAF